MDKKSTALLSKNCIFEGLTAEQINGILPCIVESERSFRDGECVYEKGAEVRDLGVVLGGKLLVQSENADGSHASAGSIEPNGMFGELVVFSTDGVLPHRVVACGDTTVLFLSGDFFRQLCGGGKGKDADKAACCREVHSEVVNNMLRMLSDKAILLGKKIAYLTAPDLKTKIAMYLCELYELSRVTTFNMPLNRDRLAEFFSVARPSLSRELINLKNQNVIDFYRSSVKILDLEALYAMARGE